MNNDTFKQAFSALHASNEIKLENDMTERKMNRKFHMRPAIAVCLCSIAVLGCFSTAFALDAGGVKTAIEDTITLAAGEKHEGTLPDGGEYKVEVAEDSQFDINVVEDKSNPTIIMEIKNKEGSSSVSLESDNPSKSEKSSKSDDSSKSEKSSKSDDSSKSEKSSKSHESSKDENKKSD